MTHARMLNLSLKRKIRQRSTFLMKKLTKLTRKSKSKRTKRNIMTRKKKICHLLRPKS